MHTYTHWLHAAKAYLQCSQEVKQSGVVVGGGAKAAVCEIEAPDVSQGLSRAMGRNGKIIKGRGRREPRERLGTSHAAIMGISSREPKHSYCSRCRPAREFRPCHEVKTSAVATAFQRQRREMTTFKPRQGDVRLIFCDGIQLTRAEFSAGETLGNCRVMPLWTEKRKKKPQKTEARCAPFSRRNVGTPEGISK